VTSRKKASEELAGQITSRLADVREKAVEFEKRIPVRSLTTAEAGALLVEFIDALSGDEADALDGEDG
jgi:hypothetical protein